MALATPEYLWTKKYSAKRDRLALFHGGAIQAGVWDAADYKVVQRAAGANMSVDVGAGYALVPGNSPGNLGLYHIQNDATVNVAVTPSHASLPRIDQVFVEVNDSTDGGDAGDTPVFNVVAGTPTAGATLDNRNGAGAVPSNALRVADFLVPAAATTVITANIRDRRSWARGAFARIVPATGANYTTASSSIADIDSATFLKRLELTGAPLDVTFRVPRLTHSTASSYVSIGLAVDGSVTVEQGTDTFLGESSGAASFMPSAVTWLLMLAAGSHTFQPRWSTEVATATLDRSVTGRLPSFVLREDVRQNATND